MVDKITEIAIFLDEEKTKEVTDFNLDLGILEAGKTTEIPLYIENKTRFTLNTKFDLINEELTAGDLELKEDVTVLIKNDTKKMIISVTPKITTMKPISAKLNIKLDYVVI